MEWNTGLALARHASQEFGPYENGKALHWLRSMGLQKSIWQQARKSVVNEYNEKALTLPKVEDNVEQMIEDVLINVWWPGVEKTPCVHWKHNWIGPFLSREAMGLGRTTKWVYTEEEEKELNKAAEKPVCIPGYEEMKKAEKKEKEEKKEKKKKQKQKEIKFDFLLGKDLFKQDKISKEEVKKEVEKPSKQPKSNSKVEIYAPEVVAHEPVKVERKEAELLLEPVPEPEPQPKTKTKFKKPEFKLNVLSMHQLKNWGKQDKEAEKSQPKPKKKKKDKLAESSASSFDSGVSSEVAKGEQIATVEDSIQPAFEDSPKSSKKPTPKSSPKLNYMNPDQRKSIDLGEIQNGLKQVELKSKNRRKSDMANKPNDIDMFRTKLRSVRTREPQNNDLQVAKPDEKSEFSFKKLKKTGVSSFANFDLNLNANKNQAPLQKAKQNWAKLKSVSSKFSRNYDPTQSSTNKKLDELRSYFKDQKRKSINLVMNKITESCLP